MTSFIRSLFAQKKPLLRWVGWFFFGNALLFCLIGLNYVSWVTPNNFPGLSTINNALGWVFIFTTWIGHFALLAFLPCLLIIPCAMLGVKYRWIFCLSSVVAALATCLLILDSFVFQQYRFHLNGIIWQMIFSHAAMEIFELSASEISVAIGIFIGLTAIEYAYSCWLWKKLEQHPHTRHGARIAVALPTCLLFSYLMFLISAAQPGYASISQQPQAFPLYNNILAILVPLPDGLESLETSGKAQFMQPKRLTGTLHYPLQPLQFQTPNHPLNLVIIVIDTWRFDTLNHAVTPNLAEFAKNSWQFTQHFSGGNATQPGIFSLFYGLPGTYWSSMLQQKQGPLLIHELLKKHYQLGIFASAPLFMPAFDRTVFREVSNLRIKTPGKDAVERDAYVTREFKQFIDHASQKSHPFFSFVFYDAAHSYCDIPKPKGRFQPEVAVCNRMMFGMKADPKPYFNRYKNALAGVDANVGQVLATLENHHLLDNTVVVITGDHGQEFNDNQQDYWGHAGNFTHYQVQTPLLVHWPHQQSHVFHHQTSHYDIAPTLLQELLGCRTATSQYSLGKSLLSDQTLNHYLLVTSYIDFGIIEKDRITTVFPTGNYAVEDLRARPLRQANLRIPVLQQVFNDLKRFYAQND